MLRGLHACFCSLKAGLPYNKTPHCRGAKVNATEVKTQLARVRQPQRERPQLLVLIHWSHLSRVRVQGPGFNNPDIT